MQRRLVHVVHLGDMNHRGPQGQQAQHIKCRGPRVQSQLICAEHQCGIEVLRDRAQLGGGSNVLPGEVYVEASRQLLSDESA